MLEDRLLLRRFKNGSGEALSRIYVKYENYLLRLATTLLGDVNAAEDVVHEVFSSLIQSREKIKLNGSLKCFLRTCVTNRARDKIRTSNLRAAGLETATFSRVDVNGPDRAVIFSEESLIMGVVLILRKN